MYNQRIEGGAVLYFENGGHRSGAQRIARQAVDGFRGDSDYGFRSQQLYGVTQVSADHFRFDNP